MSSKKCALVTGTSRGGIGDHIARELHGRGFRVFATARQPSKVQHLKDMGLDIILMDVTDSDSIKRAAAEISSVTGGTLDILVNNSGHGYKSSLIETDIAAAKALFNVNVFGLLEVIQAFSSMLIASKGTIINMGSIAGQVPIPFEGMYNASKAALEQISKTMRVEMSPFDVKVIHVITGGIKTGFFANAGKAEFLENSPYFQGRALLGPWISGEALERLQKTPPEEFAKSVIDNALQNSPSSMLWLGHGAWETWFTLKFMWYNATDIMLRVMGLPNMKQAIFGSKKED